MYCIYCAERLSKPAKVCPFCKKLLDMNLLKQQYGAGKTSPGSWWVQNRIWLKEHGYILTPLLTLVIGLGIGTFILLSFLQIRFNHQRSAYEVQISELQAAITQKEANVDDTRTNYKKQIAEKNEVIAILSNQNETLRRVISLTRHFAENSTIIPVDDEQADYFKTNFRSLNSQFRRHQNKLAAFGYTSAKAFNLKTIPQLLEE